MSVFTRIKAPKLRRSHFNLSHERKLSLNFGELVPCLVEEVLPGDSFTVNTEVMMRAMPMLAPLLHRVNAFVHYFFVPNRLLWKNWQRFITGGEHNVQVTSDPDPLFPTFSLFPALYKRESDTTHAVIDKGQLADYLLNLGYYGAKSTFWTSNFADYSDVQISQLPLRAYQLIWNEYYRDETFQAPIDILFDRDGDINASSSNTDKQNLFKLLGMKYRAYEHDYFTSAMPWTQRGDEINVVSMSHPEIDSDISFSGGYMGATANNPSEGAWNVKNKRLFGSSNWSARRCSDGSIMDGNLTASMAEELRVGSTPVYLDPTEYGHTSALQVRDGEPIPMRDISGELDNVYIENLASTVTVNDIRTAFQVQRWLERNARGGARYIESILAHFGVRSSDSRLQRPEFLGGGKLPIQISEVLGTANGSATAGGKTYTSVTGDLKGHGYSHGSNHGFKRFFEEHGIVIGILSVVPRTSYCHQIQKAWLKKDKYDFAWPEFAHLGEQQISNCEMQLRDKNGSANSSWTTGNNGAWGYLPRYSEYRYRNSSVHGDFLGENWAQNTNLDYWHMARKFTIESNSSAPNLNDSFIMCYDGDPANLRPFYIQDNNYDHLYAMIYHHISAKRPLPKFGTPGFIDH